MKNGSLIYTANTTAQAVAVGGTINIGGVARRRGCKLTAAGNTIVAAGGDYYDADVTVTAVPTAAGTVTVTMFQDGVAVPGATGSATVAAAATSVDISFPAVFRTRGNTSAITLVLTGAASSVTNAAVSVIEL